ncbi:four helix bundle protein [uncultured Mucilaginibacter sp.]|uniref:four helix bundle protein n=1 Tax=uncultured Mucilaginibacter sp. TaxID=797541 RepID=UPI0025F73EF4|nr:four helix bundle protein [uncultured Mucilaginibacter sp.]
MSNRIEEIEVHNLAEMFADEVWFITIKWDFFAKDTVGKQLVGSADSISANIAEGFGRFHYKENKNFCFFSRGSIIETKGWLKKAKTRGLIEDETYQSLLKQLETIHLKLNIYIKNIGK